MQLLGKAFLLGLATVLPVALTLYLVYVLGVGAERVMGNMIEFMLPEGAYWPGMGLVAAVLVITSIGLLMRLPGLGLLVKLNDAVMSRIPLVKTVYSTIRDFTDLVTRSRDGGQVGRPVNVKLFDEVELIGLVTNEDVDGDGQRALVYLPMSYQLGGYMLALGRDRLRSLDMTVEDTLRYVVTAGIQRNRPGGRRG